MIKKVKSRDVASWKPGRGAKTGRLPLAPLAGGVRGFRRRQL